MACSNAQSPKFSCANQTEQALTYSVRELPETTNFETAPTTHGTIQQDEISRIVRSHNYLNGLWAIQDSGNSNLLYLYNKDNANVMGIIRLEGMINSDWEDLASGYSTSMGNYLLIPDFGNNKLAKKDYIIYRFSEPNEPLNGTSITTISTGFEELHFKYPNEDQNAEALITDPQSQDIYIITKAAGKANVYIYPYPQSTEKTDTLIYLGSLPINKVTAADYNETSQELLIKEYDRIFYYSNKNKLPLCELLFTEPTLAPYRPVEPQGEAICWYEHNYFLLSERSDGVTPIVYQDHLK